MKLRRVLLMLAIILASPVRAWGQSSEETQLAKQTQNPIADLVSVPLQLNFDSGGDFGDRSMTILNIQPVLPVPLVGEWMMIARTIIPLVSVPDTRSGNSDGGLGDIQMELFFSSGQHGSFMWGLGPTVSIPTATLDAVSTGSWGLGPAGVAVFDVANWVLGGLVTQTWTIADYGDDRDINQMLIQPFVNYNFGRGFAATMAPKIIANWADNTDWIVPIGGGVSWTTKIADQAVNLGVQYYNNLERARGGADNEVRFIVSFLFPKASAARPQGTVASKKP